MPTIAPPIESENLLLASVNCLINHVKKYTELEVVHFPYLTRTLIWFLIGRSQFSLDVQLTDDVTTQLINFSAKSLRMQCDQLPHYDTTAVESALDCCSLVS